MKKPLSRKEAREQGIVCVCNLVSRDAICAAIARGCKTLDRVSAATTAGAGQCGGTCRPEISELIAEILAGDGAGGGGGGGGSADDAGKGGAKGSGGASSGSSKR